MNMIKKKKKLMLPCTEVCMLKVISLKTQKEVKRMIENASAVLTHKLS